MEQPDKIRFDLATVRFSAVASGDNTGNSLAQAGPSPRAGAWMDGLGSQPATSVPSQWRVFANRAAELSLHPQNLSKTALSAPLLLAGQIYHRSGRRPQRAAISDQPSWATIACSSEARRPSAAVGFPGGTDRDPRGGLGARVFLSILTSRAGARISHRTIPRPVIRRANVAASVCAAVWAEG